MNPDPLTRFDELLALGMDTTMTPVPGGWHFVTTVKNYEHGTLVPEFVTLTLLIHGCL